MGAFLTYTWDLMVRGGSAAAGFLGGMNARGNGGLTLLLLLMVVDYVTGLLAAALGRSKHTEHGGLSSAAGWKGLLRKALTLLVVLLSVLLDCFVNQGNAMFQSAVTWFYISNEAISLVENLARCGVPVPRRVRAMLEQMRREDDVSPLAQRDSQNQSDTSPPLELNTPIAAARTPHGANATPSDIAIPTFYENDNSSVNNRPTTPFKSSVQFAVSTTREASIGNARDASGDALSDSLDRHIVNNAPRFIETAHEFSSHSPPYHTASPNSHTESPHSCDPCAAFRVPEHRQRLRRAQPKHEA